LSGAGFMPLLLHVEMRRSRARRALLRLPQRRL
jgi:hypothetical protein